LGTAPLFVMPIFYAHFYAQRTPLAPIYTQSRLRNPWKPRSGWL